MLEALADGAAGLWHHSVLAGAREHQTLILGYTLGFAQSFLQCRITTFVSGHYKSGEWLGKQLQWGPGQSLRDIPGVALGCIVT